MSLNSTPNAMRIQIGFFGRVNSGKSSLVNAITSQNISVVSPIKGTTTDAVSKAMELLPLGAVNIIDTAGYDDDSELGSLRIEKTNQILNKVDIAVLVVDSQIGMGQIDNHLISIFKEKNIKYIIAFNKLDLLNEIPVSKENVIYVSSIENKNINEIKELIASVYGVQTEKYLLKDIIKPFDKVVLVTPIDSSAPKGRLILPQQQVIRELLEIGAITTIVQEHQLLETIKISKPNLVVTDSQIFGRVNSIIPNDIYLTSFSILFARYKGILKYAVDGVRAIETLKDGDTILISEGCTHHRQCEDIGTVKLPRWLEEYTGKNLKFEFTSGTTFPNELSKYSLIVHCGACTLNDKEVLNRYKLASSQSIPMSNYGITIAYIHNILNRSIQCINFM